MKPLCFGIKRIVLLVVWLPVLLFASPQSAVVYYGDDISWPMVGVHDYIILEPSHVHTDTHGFKIYRDKVYAYVSVGEARKRRPWFQKLKKEWILGENKAWGSHIMDVSNEAYRRFLMREVFAPLYRQGFRNFFLDTLDSYRLVSKPDAYKRYEEGIVALVKAIKQSYPKAGIILNRGFELLNQLHDQVDAVLFESYYRGLGGKDLAYVKKSDQDRAWLDKQIAKAKRFKIPVISLEYLKDPFSKEAERIRQKLLDKGLIPYISDKTLQRYGQSAYRVQKREILILYNGEGFEHSNGEDSSAHLITSLPIEYLGYVPVLRDIRRGLPKGHPEDRFAGVVIQVNRESEHGNGVAEWVMRMHERHLSVAITFLWPSLESGFFEKLGLKVYRNRAKMKVGAKYTVEVNKYHHFEMKPVVQYHDTYLTPEDANATFRYKDADGHENTLAAITPWGGYCVDESFTVELGKDTLWIVDPFRFFKEALRLKPIPVPDPTTENGRRVLFTHIDGDGIMNRAEWNQAYSGEVIYEKILKHYHIPHSVSVIGAEIMPNGLYPEESPQLMALARKIFSLPNVEPATHMFSHPFVWYKIKPDGSLDSKYRLDVPGYRFSLDSDIKGSLDFITQKLLPKGKAPARLIFWSGDCMPTIKVLHYVYSHDYLAINGGDTYITRDHPWMSYIAPLGIKKGAYWQVYTGQQNENVYTNEFHGPFWGFKKVIQTFEMTDKPRRFKPVNIYYHFYSGSKRATLKALQYVFDWAMKHPLIPMYASDYIKKVLGFYDASLALGPKGEWIIAGVKDVRSVRLQTKEPKGIRGDGYVGRSRTKTALYLHFDGRNRIRFASTDQKEPWGLGESNARVVSFVKEEKGARLQLRGYVPLTALFDMQEGCRVTARPKPDKKSVRNGHVRFVYKKAKEAWFNVSCQ